MFFFFVVMYVYAMFILLEVLKLLESITIWIYNQWYYNTFL